MKLEDYKDGLIVEIKGNSYGTFKTYKLEPKAKGAQLVKVLHRFSWIIWLWVLPH